MSKYRLSKMDSSSHSKRGSVTALSAAVFIIVLAGSTSISSLTDGAYASPVPEALLASVSVLLLTLVTVIDRSREKAVLTGFATMVPFFLWAMLGTLWGAVDDGVIDAGASILTLGALCATTAILCQQDARRFALVYLRLSVGAGIVFSIAGILSAEGSRVAAFGGGPNVFARVTAVGALATLYLVFKKKAPVVYLAFVPVMVSATVLSGSRGAMLGLLVAVIFLVPPAWRARANARIRWLSFVVLSASIAVALALKDRLTATIEWRVIELTFNERYSSGRDALVGVAWQMLLEKPVFGWGLHSFETLWRDSTGFSYPHNLLLQIGSELGIVGLALFFFVLLRWVSHSYSMRASTGSLARMFDAFALLYLTVSMFSGDYYDARQVFVVILVSIALRSTSATQSCQAPVPANRLVMSAGGRGRGNQRVILTNLTAHRGSVG